MAVGAPYDVLVYVLAYGGLRWGEAVAHKRKRFDEVRGRLKVAESIAEVNGILHWGATKTHARRSVVLPGFLRAMVRAHLDDRVPLDPEALLFAGAKGGPLRGTSFRKGRWAPALRAARLPDEFRIHDLRHTCAALLIAENANPKLVQAHLATRRSPSPSTATATYSPTTWSGSPMPWMRAGQGQPCRKRPSDRWRLHDFAEARAKRSGDRIGRIDQIAGRCLSSLGALASPGPLLRHFGDDASSLEDLLQ